jgi:branched-chain amino acid transport system permease protein
VAGAALIGAAALAAASGLLAGGFYGLIASGFALVLGVARVFNLAHGELLVAGGYLAERAWAWSRIHPLLVLPFAALFVGVAAASGQRVLRRVPPGPDLELRVLILTFGGSLLIQSLLQAAFTSDYRLVSIPGWDRGIGLPPLRVPGGRVVAGLAGLAILLALHLLFTRTTFGKALRAVSADREAASMMGIDPIWADRWALGLGGALAGAAGCLFVALQYITPAKGMDVTLTALTVTILGGVGQMLGLLGAGLAYGLAESLAVFLLGAQWREAFGLAVLLGLLRWRGHGLAAGRRY